MPRSPASEASDAAERRCRLFLALELPGPVRESVEVALRRLRRYLPEGRWVRAENVHVTLVFLGATPESSIELVSQALAPVFARRPAPELRLGSPGVFPRRSAARVLWLGLDGGEGLLELQREAAAALTAGLGMEPEARRFHPHLTLARCKQPWSGRRVDRFEAAAAVEPTAASVRHGTLFESHLGAGGPRYEVRCTFPFAESVAPASAATKDVEAAP